MRCSGRSSEAGRRGLNAAELLVVLAVVGLVVLLIALALPRQRERARTARCQQNLMQIGVALGIYTQIGQRLPGVPPPGSLDSPVRPGPLAAMIETLIVPDFDSLEPGKVPPTSDPVEAARERMLIGFLCPSDPSPVLWSAAFRAPINYRANTGDSSPGGVGPFSPGLSLSFEEVEAADGSSYTAAFSERLLGTGTSLPDLANYAAVDRLTVSGSCPADLPPQSWRGDAGTSWVEASWRSTLYHHGLTPNATPSCIALDGQTARVGASSGHPGRSVHVLLLDGSVRPYGRNVDARVWGRLATIRDAPAPPTAPDSVGSDAP